MRRQAVSVALAVVCAAVGSVSRAEPTVPEGYAVEAYVTGLQNPNAIVFSPGGDFGYEGQLFVGDSRPNPGTIYRVPSKDEKIFFTSGADNEIRSFEFAPVDSAFGPYLYATHAYSLWKYDSAGVRTRFSSLNAFGWDIAFAPDERFRNHLFHADGWEPAGDGEAIREWSPDGTAALLIGHLPEETAGLAFAPGGEWGEDLYVAFCNSRGSTPAIRIVSPEGIMTDFVVSPEFRQTNRLAFDTAGYFRGHLFVSDFERDVIFEITPDGNVSVFASGFSFSQTPHHKIDGGDLVFGPDGALYVCDGGAGTVWRIEGPQGPAAVAIARIKAAMTKKESALEKVDEALEKEQAACDALDALLAGGQLDGLYYRDIVRAQQEIHTSIQHQLQAKDALEKSIAGLHDALEALGANDQEGQ